ncbi:hypothetical protein ES332_A13G182600v1 [Gossypium tomentosum]|uniref:Uncharacterized protein n=1 Tax=Gossypium tomentosum TaxID=34277 RepID=A0A5D2MLX2_GOSTO|nr:hypothetical protein ES332_A13G182600v1 [Gossypium tomentosum]
MRVNASPSTTTSWKSISSAIVTAYRHALSSAITGSGTFSHGKIVSTTPIIRKTCYDKGQSRNKWLIVSSSN